MQLVRILPQRWRELAHEVAKFGALGANNLNRRLPRRLQGISDELAKFGVIGLVNVLVNLAVFNLLLRTVLDSGEVKAKAVATIVATTCAYFMNRHWTYRDRPKSTLRREYTLFLFFNAVGLVIEVAVVWIAKYGFGQTSDLVFNICTGIGIGLGTIFRFWAYRNHVFKLDSGSDQADEPALLSAAAALAAVPDPGLVDDSTNDGHRTAAGPVNHTPVNGAQVNGTSTTGTPINGTTINSITIKGTPGKGTSTTGNTINGAPVNGSLQDELTQIELDSIVAGEQADTHSPS